MDGINANSLGHFEALDEKYYILEILTKERVDKTVEKINNETKTKTTIDENNPKDFNFEAVRDFEVWQIIKKYSAGYDNKHIANYLSCKREEEYKKLTGEYAEKKIKFPVSRVQQVIKILR